MNRCATTAIPLEQILNTLIKRGFPELSRLRRRIAIGFATCDGLLCYDFEAGRFIIWVDELLRGSPRRALEGGIAHELAHLLHDSRLSPMQRERTWMLYERSIWYRVRDERNTDRQVIDRGYGHHLLAFMKHARAQGVSFCSEHGLRLAEVRTRAGVPS
jgi:hypothetical protein